jgi:predicted enzyme related to lactoylglutathione lyase
MKRTTGFIILVFLGIALFFPSNTQSMTKGTTMRIKLTSVYVRNPAEAIKFYTEVLGFKEEMYVPESNLAIVVSPIEPEGTMLLLEPIDHPLAKTYQEGLYKEGIPVIVFGVEDIQIEYKRLKKLGVVFKNEPTETEWGIVAMFDDTCGNYIQLYQETSRSQR